MKTIHHICIQTERYKESLDFYLNVLGFSLVVETPNFHGRDYNTWLKLDSFMIELQTPKKGDSFKEWSSLNEGIVHMCLLCDNLDEEYKAIKAFKNVKFKVKNGEEIYKVENGRLFKIKAPEGTEIEIREDKNL